MQEEVIRKLDIQFLPYLVDGKVTKQSQLCWLAFRGVVTLDNLEKYEYRIRPDKSIDGKTSCKTYEKTIELLDVYLNAKMKLKSGKIEPKVFNSNNEIDPESIPF